MYIVYKILFHIWERERVANRIVCMDKFLDKRIRLCPLVFVSVTIIESCVVLIQIKCKTRLTWQNVKKHAREYRSHVFGSVCEIYTLCNIKVDIYIYIWEICWSHTKGVMCVRVGRTNCQGCNPVGISGLGRLDRKTYSILMQHCNVAEFNEAHSWHDNWSVTAKLILILATFRSL